MVPILACQNGTDGPAVPTVLYENEIETEGLPEENLENNVPAAVTRDAGLAQTEDVTDAGNSQFTVSDSGVVAFEAEADAGPDMVAPARDAGIQDDCVELDNPSYFAQKVWGEVLSNQCIGCHNAQGLAASSDLVLQSASQLGFMDANYQCLSTC